MGVGSGRYAGGMESQSGRSVDGVTSDGVAAGSRLLAMLQGNGSGGQNVGTGVEDKGDKLPLFMRVNGSSHDSSREGDYSDYKVILILAAFLSSGFQMLALLCFTGIYS